MTQPDSNEFDDLLDLGLSTAFRTGQGEPDGGGWMAAAEPVARERLADLPPTLGRFRVVEIIAEGGMGVVLRAHDPELDREVAVKLLKRANSARPPLQRMFRAEARVMARLQHPGIVPVHDVGATPDGRLYYAMKLVGGETLQTMLAAAGSGDRPRLLAIFARVCEAVAFAHSHGVIHGDLTPANVMVGDFGEVQVLDWGFALAVRASAEDRSAGEAGPRVLGTPAFMAPEQARGAVERLDARMDVFGLGGILCAILTGHPPYRGASREDVYLRASKGWLDDAMQRLAASDADRDLIDFARDCLAVDPDARPADAGVVAARVLAYSAAAQQRAHGLALEAAAARARAAEERKARRTTLLLSAIVVAVVLASVAGWQWSRNREARLLAEVELRASAAMERVQRLREVARAADDQQQAQRWREAAAVARELGEVAQGPNTSADLAERLQQLREATELEARAALRDEKVRRLLEEVHPHMGEDRTPAQIEAGYRELLAAFAVDVDVDQPAAIAAAVRASPLAGRVGRAMHGWAHQRRRAGTAGWERLLRLADLVDPDPWRTELRRLCGSRDPQALRRLAERPDLAAAAGDGLGVLGECLAAAGERQAAVQTFRLAQLHNPGDHDVLHDLAVLLERLDPPPRAEITRLFTAAAALQPRSAHDMVDLATALQAEGDLDSAMAWVERACALDPDYRRAWTFRAGLEQLRGDDEAAIVAARELVRIAPQRVDSFLFLAHALRRAKRFGEALAVCQAGAARHPEAAEAHRALGLLELDLGGLETALGELQRAVELDPANAVAFYQLGLAQQQAGRYAAAEASYRRAQELDPKHAETHCNLGRVLMELGRFDEAVAAMRRGDELGRARGAEWTYRSDLWLQEAESVSRLAPELDSVLAAEAPRTPAPQLLGMAQVAVQAGRDATAADLLEWAYEAEPELLLRSHLVALRCAGRLAAAADRRTADRGRDLARRWLEAAAAALEAGVAAGAIEPAPARLAVQQWRLMPELDGLRIRSDANEPPAADPAWRALWRRIGDVAGRLDGR